MAYSIFIDGAAGTTGLQVHGRLQKRTELSVHVLDEQQRKDADARAKAMADADLTILCLPDEAAIQAVQMAKASGARLIDASSAHRIAADFTYGFAEMTPEHKDAIRSAQLVSNPGCYPTGFLGLIAPLRQAGLLSSSVHLSAVCVSGYSGGGKTMIARYEGKGEPAFAAYGLHLSHKHLPEMKQHACLDHAPIFLPSVGGFAQGMLVNIPLHQEQFTCAVQADDIRSVFVDHYSSADLVSLGTETSLTEFGFLSADPLAGTDRLELFVFANAENSQFVLTARLDNLGKGAAGAAVQNMNLMLGLEPVSGLNY
jgi:N-acetyl-gamma-glutamyl-phosphate reductase